MGNAICDLVDARVRVRAVCPDDLKQQYATLTYSDWVGWRLIYDCMFFNAPAIAGAWRVERPRRCTNFLCVCESHTSVKVG